MPSGAVSNAQIDAKALSPLPENRPVLPVESVAAQSGIASQALAASKFAHSDREALSVQTERLKEGRSEVAYQDVASDALKVSSMEAPIRPLVGKWLLSEGGRKKKSIVPDLGLFKIAEKECVVTLEASGSSFGYRASGGSACPTDMFMLEYWVSYGDRIVLRDHMGDEILQLKARGAGLWMGINRDGKTYFLEKS